ncbi:chaplin [Streptomyces sp. NPDC005784]|uniref:chaplin n=1 Tax=Streptomyces sp. NPDC005784 TaxID=3364731 RepID=UPI0036C0C62D
MRQNLSRGVVLAAAATGIMSLYASPAIADSNATATASDSPGVASGNNVQVPVNVPVNLCGNTVDVVAALNPAFGNSCANGSGSHGRHAAPHHPAQYDASSVHGSRHAPGHSGADDSGGGYGGHSGGGYGGEHGGQGGYGGHSGGEHGGYGDSGYGHSGYRDSGHGGSWYGESGHGGRGYDDSGAHHGGWSGSSSYGGTHGSPGVLSGDQTAAPVDVPVELCGNSVDVIGLLNPVLGNECASEGHATTPPHTPPRTVHEHPPTPHVYTPPVKVHEQPPGIVHQRYTPPATMAETGSEGLLATTAASAALLAGGTVLYRRSRAASRP